MGTKGSTMLEPLRRELPPIGYEAVSSSATCSLAPHYESVGGARRFTRSALSEWDLDDHFDTVALVVSELVTNALRHALPDALSAAARQDPAAGTRTAEPAVRLHLMRWSTHLVCAVRDPSRDSPVTGRHLPEDPERAGESGRGLHLVEAFSDNWGWHPLAGTLRGKVVWALFRLPALRVRQGPVVT
ncbi:MULTISPECIES: ATP-binding protein [Streptomyces]|uniref:ATP-binding protein n=1 Tax=Streptomyces TaxID=1883 RepID=UPI0002F2595F|nr:MULTISPECIES: ATP-binding protein [Streptomyces]MCC5032099.1 ATP-binding protein [Streptomyces sp. WAC 00631]MZE80434.1 ATP-binding protein [Streptomyces sp. SID5475]